MGTAPAVLHRLIFSADVVEPTARFRKAENFVSFYKDVTFPRQLPAGTRIRIKTGPYVLKVVQINIPPPGNYIEAYLRGDSSMQLTIEQVNALKRAGWKKLTRNTPPPSLPPS